jgi:EAL domain-containing protein (putative c-di-GMP-specific phosphodiesterase class I)
MQGFLFARPAPAKTIDRLLAQPKRSARAPMPPEALTA